MDVNKVTKPKKQKGVAMKPRALDLFCKAGGASMGLHRAGFEVIGVDIEPQSNYPFKFIQRDALELGSEVIESFDFFWASPPCQGFTAYKRNKGHVKPRKNLIPATRRLLSKHAKNWVIENVPGAPLKNPTTLCGSMFGLDVRRHRLFESNFTIEQPKCNHKIWTPRFPPASNRTNKRLTVEVGVWRIPLNIQQKAMGIDWMNLKELSEAIPPAYSEYIARQLLHRLEHQEVVS